MPHTNDLPSSLAPGTWNLTFDDEFDDPTAPLNVADGGPFTNAYMIWGDVRTLSGNGEQELYVDPKFVPNPNDTASWNADAPAGSGGTPLGVNPFSYANGNLDITAIPTPSSALAAGITQPYLSGMISTEKTFTQQYGYFEMRAELPSGQGLWPAFWLYGTTSTSHDEIDVMEALGNNTGQVYQSMHSNVGGDSVNSVPISDYSTGFHTYGVEWSPTEITYFVDGQQTIQMANPFKDGSPMYMIANLAVGGSWGGNADSATPFPATMQIDYIRAYQNTSWNPSTAVIPGSTPTPTPTPTPSTWISVSNPGTVQEASPGAGVDVTETATDPGLPTIYEAVFNAANQLQGNWQAVATNAQGVASFTAHLAQSGDYVCAVDNPSVAADKGWSAQVTITDPVPAAPSPTDTLVLDVSEDAYLGDATFTVAVNGVQTGGTLTASESHSVGQDTAVTLTGNYGADPTVVVTFTNDLNAGVGADRNLFVDGMTYDGIAQTGSASLYSDGSAAFALHGSVTPASSPKATLMLTDDTGATAGLGVISSGSEVTLGGSQIALDGNIRQSIDGTGVVNISTDTFASGVVAVTTKDAGGASYHLSNFIATNVELGGARARSMATAGSLTIDGATGGNVKLDAGNYKIAIAAAADPTATTAQNQFNITLGNTGNQNELHVDDSGTPGVSTNIVQAGSGVDKMWFIDAASTTVYGGSNVASVICNSGTNSFIAGSGTMIVTGGAGADSFTFHDGDGLLRIYHFSLSKGDTLTVDNALSGAMTEGGDGHGGLMIGFGLAGHGVDLVGVSSLTPSQIHFA